MNSPELNTYKITCVSQVISPLTHNSGTEGNETLIATEPVQTRTGKVWVPFLSGNALRHRMIRQPGMEYLVDRLNLSGKMNIDSLQFLFAGGALWKSKATENMDRIKSMWQLFPLLRVLGGSLPDTIVPGHLDCWRGTLICRENGDRLPRLLPNEDWWDEGAGLLSAQEWISGYQYTRQDPAKQYADMLTRGPEGEPEETNQMIFNGQTVREGACFVHGFHLRQASELDLGALLLSLALWQRDIQTFGGASARGHGRLDLRIHIEPTVDQNSYISAYIDHVEEHREECVDWLSEEYEMGGLLDG